MKTPEQAITLASEIRIQAANGAITINGSGASRLVIDGGAGQLYEIKRPDGIVISLFFIGAIVATSLVSRVYRSLELRQERIELDETAMRFVTCSGGSP